MKTKFNCEHCGFKAQINSDHKINYCPSCHKNQEGKKEKGFWDRVADFGNWCMEPQTLYEYRNIKTPEFAEAAAKLKAADADYLRASKGLPEGTKIVHIHTNPEQQQRIKRRTIELIEDEE